jgi:hypothetical protein
VIERFQRTLKEQCRALHRVKTLEEAWLVIAECIERYTTEWLLERLGTARPCRPAPTPGWPPRDDPAGDAEIGGPYSPQDRV